MSPRTIKALRDLFEAEAEKLFDRLLAMRRIEAVKDLAECFPLKVFPDAVGLEAEGRDNLLLYGDMVFNALGRAMSSGDERRCERSGRSRHGS